MEYEDNDSKHELFPIKRESLKTFLRHPYHIIVQIVSYVCVFISVQFSDKILSLHFSNDNVDDYLLKTHGEFTCICFEFEFCVEKFSFSVQNQLELPRTFRESWGHADAAKGSSNNDVSQRIGGRGWEEADALISVGGA